MSKNPGLILVLLFFISTDAFSQRKKRNREDMRSPKQELVYENKTYIPEIKTVQALPNGKEAQLPIIDLEGGDRLEVSFDDLRADVRNYFYNIEHCDMDWKPSRATVLDYAKGFNEDRIDNFSASLSTTQPYTHYRFSFPNEYVAPRIPGNYLLKIYEDADKSRLIITQRFYVVRDLIKISAQATLPLTAPQRHTHQKINVDLTTGLTINNPDRDLHIMVMQNRRPDYQMILSKPMFAGNGTFRYNNSQTLNFKGNNEFRFVDLRTLRAPSTNVTNISRDSLFTVEIRKDETLKPQAYASTFDENGAFYIRNNDFSDDPNITADYAEVNFKLDAPKDIEGEIYLVGHFNNFQQLAENQLTYDSAKGLWTCTLKLKQGLYDYDYVLVDRDGNVHTDALSGTHFATGNDYQILVYHRRMGSYWDELLGFSEVEMNNRR